MATAPYGIRLLVGAAVTALEETKRLPQTILMYPMTVASTLAHIVMKMQQDLADLVIKGDMALDTMFPPKLEQAEWATFDEDLPAADSDADSGPTERRTEGRFALYSVPDNARVESETPDGVNAEPIDAEPIEVVPPAIAGELDYGSLTLAQLRARLQSLNVEELEALLAYEESSKARAPFQTLLANRIIRASAK